VDPRSLLADAADARRQPKALEEASHRPWPLPEEPWLMGQTWSTLLFAHWRVDPAALERLVPPQLPLDLREGCAWLGVTPFLISGLRLRGAPPLPCLSRFPELNVRTYVTVEGRPGIYFLSLDAARLAAVLAARRGYRLPYFHARMSRELDGESVRFSSDRVSRDGPPAHFAARYRPLGPERPPAPASLEAFLTERYRLYTLDEDGHVLAAEIHHRPWPLCGAEARLDRNEMALPLGLELEEAPILHFARRQDVVIWPLRALPV
jgi:uncharacterized protein YqjF (DUF2071 family)